MRLRKRLQLLVVISLLVSSFFVFSTQSALAECGVHHTVTPGQNLFRIGLRYGVSMYDIAAANGITDIRVIYAGQVLYIPCVSVQGQPPAATNPTAPVYIVPDGSGYTYTNQTPNYVLDTVPPQPSTVIAAPLYAAVDCGGFQATSPLDGFRDGQETFYWNSPAGSGSIAIYQVVILDDRGTRLAAFTAAGGATRASGDVSFGAIGGRSRFSWYVVALVNGNEVCRTQITTLNRQWNPNAGLSS
jgi:LysM repeat protein